MPAGWGGATLIASVNASFRYLAYGSNLHPARLGARVSGARLLGPVALPGWSLRFHKRGIDGSAKADLVPAESEGVAWGAVFAVDADALTALDRFEGRGHGYERAPVELEEFGTCVTYRAMEAYLDPALKPFDWYRAWVEAGARFHGFPPTVAQALAAVPATPDPDADRAALNWTAISRL